MAKIQIRILFAVHSLYINYSHTVSSFGFRASNFITFACLTQHQAKYSVLLVTVVLI